VTTVDGTVRYDFVCPPGPAGGDCVAIAYLSDDALAALPTHPEEIAVRLYDHGRPVSCGAASLAGIACLGWPNGARYRVRGTLRQQDPQGRPLPDPYFDVIDSAPRG
jgi:hypothetical protein